MWQKFREEPESIENTGFLPVYVKTLTPYVRVRILLPLPLKSLKSNGFEAFLFISRTFQGKMARTASFDTDSCHFCHHSFLYFVPKFVDLSRYLPVINSFLFWFFQSPQLKNLRLQSLFCACKWPSDDKNDDKNLADKYRQNPHGARLSAIAHQKKDFLSLQFCVHGVSGQRKTPALVRGGFFSG